MTKRAIRYIHICSRNRFVSFSLQVLNFKVHICTLYNIIFIFTYLLVCLFFFSYFLQFSLWEGMVHLFFVIFFFIVSFESKCELIQTIYCDMPVEYFLIALILIFILEHRPNIETRIMGQGHSRKTIRHNYVYASQSRFKHFCC